MQPLERVQNLVTRWKAQGLGVGFTNGCCDILHSGHMALLARARSECDWLVVGLNTDASGCRLKGPIRRMNALDARKRLMAALRHVDCVVASDEATPLGLIRALVPDVLVKGADYTMDQVVGADVAQAAGGRVVPGVSRTGIVARMRQPAPAA